MLKSCASRGGFTLLEVLVMSIVLGFFLLGFYEGSQRMAVSMRLNQNRTEALMQLRRIGQKWRAGEVVTGITSGYFLNGTAYTVGQSTATYSATNSTLTKLAVTVGWSEPNPNSTAQRKMRLKDLYYKY